MKNVDDRSRTVVNKSPQGIGFLLGLTKREYKGDNPFKVGGFNLDYGSGFHNHVADMLDGSLGIRSFRYDPYSVGVFENIRSLIKLYRNNGADSVTCLNVLNVIDNTNDRIKVVQNIAQALKYDGAAIFTVYEGTEEDRRIGARSTEKGWQEFRKIETYVDVVRTFFADVVCKYRMIIARKPLKVARMDMWQLDQEGREFYMNSFNNEIG